MRIVKVRNVEFGTGCPKIAVPITGKSSDDIIKQAETIMSSNNADLIEWRIDFFDQVEDAEKLVETAKKLRQVMSEMPLLTTFRTHFEGGVKKLSEEEYFDICRVLIKEKATDLLDLELFRKTSKLKEIIAEAHENNIYIIMRDRKSTRLNSSHASISYAVFCLKKKKYINRGHSSSGVWEWKGHDCEGFTTPVLHRLENVEDLSERFILNDHHRVH